MSETSSTAGARLRAAVDAERPLQVVGTINAYSALLAQRAGFRALYLSGAGVANASFGLPDLGMTSLNDVCEDVRRITAASDAAAAGGCRHRLGWRVQHRPDHARPDQRRRGRHAPGGPGGGQALRAPAGQGARAAGRDGRSHQGRGRWPHRWQLRHHGAHRCACGRGPGRGRGARAGLCRRRRRHDLRRGAHDPRGVPRVHRQGARAGARQHHRVRPDAAVHRRRARRGGRAPGAVSACRRSAPPPGPRGGVRRDPQGRHAAGGHQHMQTRAELYEVLGYHDYEKKLDQLFGK